MGWDNGWSHIKPPIIFKTILPTPHHYFLKIYATGPLSLPTIRGIHLIILSAWWCRNSILLFSDSMLVLSNSEIPSTGDSVLVLPQDPTPTNPKNHRCQSFANPFIMRSASTFSIFHIDHSLFDMISDNMELNIEVFYLCMMCGILRKWDGTLVVTKEVSWSIFPPSKVS